MTKQSFYAPTGSYSFSTKTLACFSKLANAFYPSKIQVVPTNIIELLTPIGQSAWFGDDGNLRLKVLLRLNANSYVMFYGKKGVEKHLFTNMVIVKYQVNHYGEFIFGKDLIIHYVNQFYLIYTLLCILNYLIMVQVFVIFLILPRFDLVYQICVDVVWLLVFLVYYYWGA